MPVFNGFDWISENHAPIVFGELKKQGTFLRADAPFEQGYLPTVFPMSPPLSADAPFYYSISEPKDTDYHVVVMTDGKKFLLQTGKDPQGEFTLTGLPPEFHVIQPVIHQLSTHQYRMYFWAHYHETPRKVRLMEAESSDGFHWKVGNGGKPVFWHHSDIDCQTGKVPTHLQCNDATAIYPMSDGRWEVFSASLIHITDPASRYYRQELWKNHIRVVQRWTGDGFTKWSDPEIVLCPDGKDDADLQMYYLCATQLSTYSLGIIGHYSADTQELGMEAVCSPDRRHWLRPCRQTKVLEGEGPCFVPENRFVAEGEMLKLYYTSCNYDHSFKAEKSLPSSEIRTAVIHKHCIWGKTLDHGVLTTTPLRISGSRILLYTSGYAHLQCRLCNGFGEALSKGSGTFSVIAPNCQELSLKDVPPGEVITLQIKGSGTLFDLTY